MVLVYLQRHTGICINLHESSSFILVQGSPSYTMKLVVCIDEQTNIFVSIHFDRATDNGEYDK